jgi:very-short-patch-repair endonuclease
MKDKDLTPPAPLIRGEKPPPSRSRRRSGCPPAPPVRGEEPPDTSIAHSPSPDKGRAGEGLKSTEKAFKFLPYEKRLTALARQNRLNPTPAENLLWQKILRGKQFGQYKFLRQKPIGAYIVDFYCAELRLVVEIDGDSHAEQLAYDARRTQFLESLGLRVLRYANRDVLDLLPGVYDNLLTYLPSPNHE